MVKTRHQSQFTTNYSIRALTNHILYLLVIIAVTVTLFACASTATSDKTKEADLQDSDAKTVATSELADASATPTANADATPAAPETATNDAPVNKPAAEEKAADQTTKPPRVVASCQKEAYVKYEKEARDSIQKGLAATKAQQFGVGFRNQQEHQQWSDTHNALFNEVANACEALSNCAKQFKKEKNTKCATQAQTFQDWQAIAKNFAAKAKMAETTQPPKICSLKPNLSDAPRCFHGLADNIERDCDTADCKELSQCWHAVAFLDGVISQAEQSCSFVHQDLTQCRSYQEATTRRKNKFAKCEKMQSELNITTYPVL